MIKPDQIPDEVVMAALIAYERSADNDYTTSMYDFAVAIAAAINAWADIYPETRPDRWMQVTLWTTEKAND